MHAACTSEELGVTAHQAAAANFLGLPGPLFPCGAVRFAAQRCFMASASFCRPSGVMPPLAFAGAVDGEVSAARFVSHLAFCAAERLLLLLVAVGTDTPGTSPPTSRSACKARSIAVF